MPDKITNKNLSYDQTLPPFLARLRGQQTAGSQSPDPILAAHRRAARVRTASEEAEDAPVVVDEDGNVVQLEEQEEAAAATQQEGNTAGSAAKENGDDTKNEDAGGGGGAEKEKVAGIGATKKRKAGRVIGGDDGEEAGGVDAAIRNAVKATQKLAKEPPKDDVAKKPIVKPSEKDKGSKKKTKKIKLSFGDDDG